MKFAAQKSKMQDLAAKKLWTLRAPKGRSLISSQKPINPNIPEHVSPNQPKIRQTLQLKNMS